MPRTLAAVALFTSQRTAAGEETRVGLGWRIAADERGRRYVHHALLSNLSGTPARIEELGLALAAPFLPIAAGAGSG